MIRETVNPDGNMTRLATPRQLEASDFDPSVPGEMYKRYLYVYQPLGLAPANFFHTIPGDITPGDAAVAIDTLVTSGQVGVFYVNGDMTVPNGGISGTWPGVTLIVKGKFLSLDNNHTYANAGALVAQSISVLAGADLGTAANSYSERCASSADTWVFKVDAQKNLFKGIVYVPNGQALFVGNTSGGAHSDEVISYSLHLGISNTNSCNPNNGNSSNGCQAQSWSFNFDQSEMGDPVVTTTLQQ